MALESASALQHIDGDLQPPKVCAFWVECCTLSPEEAGLGLVPEHDVPRVDILKPDVSDRRRG